MLLSKEINTLKRAEFLKPTKQFLENTYGLRFWKEGKQYRTYCPCPSHKDSEPSFFLYVDHGVEKPPQVRMTCFGNCGFPRRNFDIFDLVQWMDNCNFHRAYQKVEAFMGTCSFTSDIMSESEDEPQNVDQEDIYRAYRRAALYYHHILLRSEDEEVGKARRELQRRKISLRVVRKYRIGYVPKLGSSIKGLAWYLRDGFATRWPVYQRTGLFRYLEKGYLKKYINKEYFTEGIARYYGDYLSGRISIPLMTDTGKVVGIQGRKVGKCSKSNRYRSAKGSSKGTILFGFHQNYDYFKKYETYQTPLGCERYYWYHAIFIVEGAFDVLRADSLLNSFPQLGCPVVGSLGGPLTHQQVKVLARHAEELQDPAIIFFLDGGAEEFILRGYQALQENPITKKLPTGFKLLPEGVDPAKFLHNPMTLPGRGGQKQDELRQRLNQVYTVCLPLPDYKGLIELIIQSRKDSPKPYVVEKEKLISLLQEEKKGRSRYEMRKYCERIATFIRSSTPVLGAHTIEVPTTFIVPEVVEKIGSALVLLLDIWIQQREKKRCIKVSAKKEKERLNISRRTYFKYKSKLVEVGFLRKDKDKMKVVYGPQNIYIKISTLENTNFSLLENEYINNLPPTGKISVPHIL